MKKNIFYKFFIFLFISVSILVFILPKSEVEAADKKKYVLYISSYSYSWESVPLQIKGIEKSLSEKCVINYEFMDTKNVAYDEDYYQYYNLLKYKLAQRPVYDGVIVADDAALKFIQLYKDELFPNTPIAFTGIDDVENAKEASKDPLISGVVENVDYQKNIDIARKLMPEATKIVFINDRKENGIGIQKQLDEQLVNLNDLEVSYLISSDYSRDEFEKKLNQLKDNTIVFLVSFGQDKDRINYTEDERMDIIEKNVSVPVFRVSSTNYPNIMLGGYVIDHKQSAYLAAEMIKNTINGQDMSKEKLVNNTPYVYCFNQKIMDKYKLNMSLLPKGTIIKNPKQTFLDENYRVVINAFAFAFIILLIITVLGIRKNLKKSQENNEKINEQKKDLELALKTKSDFLSRMSHEMRTPLNSILGCVHLANDDYKNNKSIHDDLIMIDHAGNFLLNLINDVLDVSRIDAHKFELNKEWCSPKEVIESIEFMMIPIMNERGINFECPEYSAQAIEKVEWYVDPKRTQQVIVNLLNNAAKFTPEGGNIKLKIKNLSYDDTSSIDQVTISDTGCGMSEEFISHIGEAFIQEHNKYTDKNTGSGLGLYIVKNIVEMMDGDLNVESEVGKGTTFTFNIKYDYRIKTNLNVNNDDEGPIDLKGMKVLCAEDNKMNQIVIRRILEIEGIEVDIVSNGQEAIDKIAQSKVGEYQAILMDMRMPVMGGITATQKIRKLNHQDALKMPIIALSADAIATEIEEAKLKGLNDYLTKPIVPKDLYRTLSKYWKHH